MKTFWFLARALLLLVLLLAGTSYALFRSATFQTWVASRVANWWAKQYHAEVHFQKIDIHYPLYVEVQRIYISDQHYDTLLYARCVKVDLRKMLNRSRRFELEHLDIDSGRFRLAQYPGEHDLNIQYLLDAFGGPPPKVPNPIPYVTLLRNVDLHNLRFTYQYLADSVQTPRLINFSDLLARNLNAKVDSLEIVRDTISFTAHNLSLHEKSGLAIRDFNAHMRVSPLFVEFHKLNIKTENSHLKGNFSFITKDYEDFSDFENKVGLVGTFDASELELADLMPFSEELRGIRKKIQFAGTISGTEANLKGKNLDIRFGSNSRFSGDVNMRGLPNWEKTYTVLDVEKFTTNKKDLETIPVYPFTEGTFVALPREIERLGQISFSGSFTGYEHDFVAFGNFHTALGELTSDIEMRTDSGGLANYKGRMSTLKFQLGKYFSIPQVGALTLDVSVEGRGLKQTNVNTKIRGIIKTLEFNRYAYDNIALDGIFAKNVFTGRFDVADENIDFDFDGSIDLRGDRPHFDFKSKVERADLANLNFIESKKRVVLSTQLDVDLVGSSLDDLEGTLLASNTVEVNRLQGILIKRIFLNAQKSQAGRFISLESDVVNARIEGKYSMENMGEAFSQWFSHYIPKWFEGEVFKPIPLQNFTFSATTRNSAPMSKVLLNGITILPGTSVEGRFNSQTGNLEAHVEAPRMELLGFPLSGVDLDFGLPSDSSAQSTLQARVDAKRIFLSDSATMDNVHLIGNFFTDSISWEVGWDNNTTKNRNFCNLLAATKMVTPHVSHTRLQSSQLFVLDSLWSFEQGGLMIADSMGVHFHNISAFCGKQRIGIESQPTLHNTFETAVVFENFHASWFNPLLRERSVEIDGLINGRGTLGDGGIFTATLGIKSFTFNGDNFGDGSLVALYNEKNESIGINGKFIRGELVTFSCTGFYYPFAEDQNFDLELVLDKFPLKYAEVYTEGIFSDIQGSVSGTLILSGLTEFPVLSGTLDVQRGSLMIDYMNVPYTFNGLVSFSENRVQISGLNFFDPKGKSGTFSGLVTHDYFKDMKFNFDVDVKKLMVLNTTASQNNLFYGKAFASGLARIHGDLKGVVFDIAAKSEEGTLFNIPLYGPEEVTQNSFITFVNHDTTKASIRKQVQTDLTGIQMNFDMELNSGAEFQMIFDPKVGDVISGRGDGNLKLNINTNGKFLMYGDYIIREGKYLFTLQNVINKRFNIENGSTISWNGDPFGADININAIYSLRTALSDIIPDSSRQRVRVDCKLLMSEKLMKPAIKFDILLPTANQQRRDELRAAINFDNEAELNRQVFSLLMLGSFFPLNDRTTANSSVTSGVSSNTNELVSNQVSNWLSSLSKQVSLGLNYKSDQVSNRELQLSLSKELFNSRLSIDGNVGVTNNPYAASNIIGDVNIDYKITSNGKLRVRAYNQSNDNYTQLNNAPFTQGLGLFYREDFDNFGELFARYRAQWSRMRKEEEPSPVPVP